MFNRIHLIQTEHSPLQPAIDLEAMARLMLALSKQFGLPTSGEFVGQVSDQVVPRLLNHPGRLKDGVVSFEGFAPQADPTVGKALVLGLLVVSSMAQTQHSWHPLIRRSDVLLSCRNSVVRGVRDYGTDQVFLCEYKDGMAIRSNAERWPSIGLVKPAGRRCSFQCGKLLP